MAAQLTPEQEREIEPKRRPDGRRTRYYDASTGEYTEISRDFETFILLLPLSFRARVGQYITATSRLRTSAKPLEDLRVAWTEERQSDSAAVSESYGQLVATYDEIRATLVAASEGYADVVEVQKLLGDLNRVVGGLVSSSDAAKYDSAVYNVLSAQVGSGSFPAEQSNELNSFVSTFLQYP